MTSTLSLEHQTALLPPDEQARVLRDLDLASLRWSWKWQGRPNQIRATYSEAAITFFLAGRGAGKSRTGSEWVRHRVQTSGGRPRSFFLVGRTAADVRDVMIQGKSGLMNVFPPSEEPRYIPSARRIEFYDGSVGLCFSAEEPDQLRGPQADYCFPAGTSVQTDAGPRPIENLVSGDLVWTREGLRPVEVVGSRLAPVLVTVVHERGSLTGTPEHPVWTANRGWQRLDSLAQGDTLVPWANGTSIRGVDTPGTNTATGSAGSSLALAGSGSRRTDRSRQAGTSTTSTATGWMTGKRISSFSPPPSTPSITEPTLCRWSAPSAEPVSTGTRPEPTATRAKTFADGSPRLTPTASVPGQTGGVRSAVNPSGDGPSTARSRARTRLAKTVSPGTPKGGVFSPGAAPSAAGSGRRLHGQPGSVVLAAATEPGPGAMVYNLAVQGCPEFFADGILVHNCWADELAAWNLRPDSSGLTAWDNVQIATRLGQRPQIFASTTPKRIALVRALYKRGIDPNDPEVMLVTGSTYENPHLSNAYISTLTGLYAGSRLAAQELDAEILEEVEGALWNEALLNQSRFWSDPGTLPIRVIAVDPSVSENPNDECGIVVMGSTSEVNPLHRTGYVLADHSGQMTPKEWSAKVAGLAKEHDAIVIAEANQGGALVKSVITNVDSSVRVRLVHAKDSKRLRAEPVSAVYDKKRILHVGRFAELEDQMTTWVPGDPGSPDRLDALVHGATALLLPEGKGSTPGRSRSKAARGRIATPLHRAQSAQSLFR